MLILLSNLFFASLLATNPFNINFPIAELGDCNSINECKIYCDDSANQSQCERWAQNNGFAPKGQVKRNHIGPGDCRSKEECDSFCRKPENMNTCLDFAVKDGFMTQAEADKIKSFDKKRLEKDQKRRQKREERKKHRKPKGPEINKEKVLKLLEEIGGPGGCSAFDECDKFCSNRDHEEECMAFAIEHKLFDEKDAERMKKMMDIEGPGGCHGRECGDYCEKPEHQGECIEFARKEGLMDDEEYQKAKKFIDATNGTGIGPGGCLGEECGDYCDHPQNQDECFEFFKKAGMIDPEEIEMIENMKQRESEILEMRYRAHQEEDGFREDEFRKKEENHIWEEMGNIQKHKDDESLQKFYQDFPLNTEWTPELEKQKDQYWQDVELQRKLDEENFIRKQTEPEFIEEFQGLQQPLQIPIESIDPLPSNDFAGVVLAPFINLLSP